MASDMAEIDALEPVREITVTVRIRNLWRLRLGLWLLRLAARVLRCPVSINDVPVADADG